MEPKILLFCWEARKPKHPGLAAETVINGDPTFAGPLAGVQLGLRAYHIMEDAVKKEIDPAIYEEQIGMMEMVIDVDEIKKEMSQIRAQFA
jgi:glycine reductase